MSSKTTLGDFIDQEIRKRQMSVREFAEFVGVTDKAVYNARDRLKELLHANSAADILSRAIKLKLIEPKESQDS